MQPRAPVCYARARLDETLRLDARRARTDIVSGALRGAALLDRVLAVPVLERDVWVDELLGLVAPPPDAPDLPRGSVPYLPCSVEEIVASVREAPIREHDHLVDIGSGLGRVVMLAHLLSGARASGIEIQEHLVREARARSLELGLKTLSFAHANAVDVELDGSVFFLYAPFNGAPLHRVLERLEGVSRRRPIVICAVGLALDVAWLRARRTSALALTIYEPDQ